jgi:hypothetical protein
MVGVISNAAIAENEVLIAELLSMNSLEETNSTDKTGSEL